MTSAAGVGLLGRGHDIDARSVLGPDQSQSALENGRVADHQRTGQGVQPRIIPGPRDHLRSDARHVTHRQGHQGAFFGSCHDHKGPRMVRTSIA